MLEKTESAQGVSRLRKGGGSTFCAGDKDNKRKVEMKIIAIGCFKVFLIKFKSKLRDWHGIKLAIMLTYKQLLVKYHAIINP